MGKRRKSQTMDNMIQKRRFRGEDQVLKAMDDDIDAFHKQRDVISLDFTGEFEESDEDNEHPVFKLEEEEEDDAADDDADDGNNDNEDDAQVKGFTAKLARQQKYMRQKFGGVEDDMHNDDLNQDEEENRVAWGKRKDQYYHGDNVDFEVQSSGDESLAEEEAEALRLQRKAAESLTMEDMGLEDESDRELTLEQLSKKDKISSKPLACKDAKDDMGTTFEEVKKDLDSLSREEQMDVVYSSAPELVGLLSELGDALEQLENKVNPLLNKVKEEGIESEGGVRFLEVKQLLLLAYCQAITFYLLLKSEGQSVRDHPVIARLVEIKGFLDKLKELDANLPLECVDILSKKDGAETVMNLVKKRAELESEVVINTKPPKEFQDTIEVVKGKPSKDTENKEAKHKRQDDHVHKQSTEMLKVRAALEEKLKEKGLYSSLLPKLEKINKHQISINRQLETFDDFDDDVTNVEDSRHGLGKKKAIASNKLSKLVTVKQNKLKIISGDDDLPKRDDIGERRRKHELRVLAGAGVKSDEDGGDEAEGDAGDEPWNVGEDEDDDMVDGDLGGSEDEFYKEVKQQREAKLIAKAEKYTRTTSAVLPLPETVEGKRHITTQMEKNRGLTRTRKKENKNPRKKYRNKYEDASARHKGRVREIRKPTGSYGGESTGINAGISRSTRF